MPASDRFLRRGAHPDPLDPAYRPPDPATLPEQGREALTSREMDVYRASLLLPGPPSIRASIAGARAEARRDVLSARRGYGPEPDAPAQRSYRVMSDESSRRPSPSALPAR